jgi:CPA2 family monovalent cation:H+ antiporter-2
MGPGAFIAGVLIAESDYSQQVIADIAPLRDNFLGLFFLSIGMLLDVGPIWKNLGWIVALTAVIYGLKFLAIYFTLFLQKWPKSVAVLCALGLSQVGEFSFILAESSRTLGILTENELQTFYSVSILSILITPLVQKVGRTILAGKKTSSLKNTSLSTEEMAPPADVLLMGFGYAGQSLAYTLDRLNISYRVIELNYDQVKKNLVLGTPIQWGDATQERVLRAAGIENAKCPIAK